MLGVENIASEDQFNALQPAWEKLLTECGAYSPFLSNSWFCSCLGSYGDGKERVILVVRDGVDVVGIAPLWRHHDKIRGIPIKRVEFITCPDTPFVDFILHRERREEILEVLLHYLFGVEKRNWEVLTLGQWQQESANYEVLRKILKRLHKKIFVGVSSVVPFIKIRGDWETFLQTRSVRFRKTRRNIANRITKLEKLEIQCVHQDTSGTLMNEILMVAEKSWKHEEGIAISSREETRRFFEMLTDLAGKAGWLMVWLLKVDGTPVAVEYDLEHNGNVYALRADFDEAYKEYSPGAYLEYQIIKHLFEEGYLEYNTGPGLNTYKLHWTDLSKKNVALHICNSNLKGRAVWAFESKLLPFLRGIRNATISTDVKNG